VCGVVDDVTFDDGYLSLSLSLSSLLTLATTC
jgi:hypothetical protein